jgi:hypothetical protein
MCSTEMCGTWRTVAAIPQHLVCCCAFELTAASIAKCDDVWCYVRSTSQGNQQGIGREMQWLIVVHCGLWTSVSRCNSGAMYRSLFDYYGCSNTV